MLPLWLVVLICAVTGALCLRFANHRQGVKATESAAAILAIGLFTELAHSLTLGSGDIDSKEVFRALLWATPFLATVAIELLSWRLELTGIRIAKQAK